MGVIVDSLKIDLTQGPIPIYVHSRLIPLDKVISYDSMDSLRFYYFSSLKEANTIKYPKVNEIMNLSSNDTNTLRKIVYSNDPNLIREYRTIMNSINVNGFNTVEKYPVKLIFDSLNMIFTKPFDIKSQQSTNITLKDYFNTVLTEEIYLKLKQEYKVIIHGIEVDESMPFMFYYNHFSCMDNFLYICFV